VQLCAPFRALQADENPLLSGSFVSANRLSQGFGGRHPGRDEDLGRDKPGSGKCRGAVCLAKNVWVLRGRRQRAGQPPRRCLTGQALVEFVLRFRLGEGVARKRFFLLWSSPRPVPPLVVVRQRPLYISRGVLLPLMRRAFCPIASSSP